MFGRKSFDKSLTLSSYRSTINIFTKCASLAIKSAFASEDLKRRARDLSVKTNNILADDYDEIVLVAPLMKAWMDDWQEAHQEFKTQIVDNITLIITFHRDRALYLLVDLPLEERYAQVVRAEEAMHRWENKLATLIVERITMEEANYIKKMASAIIRGDI